MFHFQNAERRHEMRSVPDVLIFQLTRFRFDWEKQRRIKVNDSIEINETLEVNVFSKVKSESSSSSSSAPSAGMLILVHSRSLVRNFHGFVS